MHCVGLGLVFLPVALCAAVSLPLLRPALLPVLLPSAFCKERRQDRPRIRQTTHLDYNSIRHKSHASRRIIVVRFVRRGALRSVRKFGVCLEEASNLVENSF